MNKYELKLYGRLKRELFAKTQTLLELKSLQGSIKAQEISATPKAHSGVNQLEMSVQKVAELEAEVCRMYEDATETMQKIVRAISTLDDPVERAVMELHYINGYTWEQVAVHVGYTWRQVHRYHGSALQKLAKL